MKKNSEVKVLTEEKIKQKMAGYKSAYCKRIKKAVNKKEAEKLLKNRDSYLAEKEEDIREQNRKAIQKRAGRLSWETRRKNESACKNHKTTSSHCTKMTVQCKVHKAHKSSHKSM